MPRSLERHKNQKYGCLNCIEAQFKQVPNH